MAPNLTLLAPNSRRAPNYQLAPLPYIFLELFECSPDFSLPKKLRLLGS